LIVIGVTLFIADVIIVELTKSNYGIFNGGFIQLIPTVIMIGFVLRHIHGRRHNYLIYEAGFWSFSFVVSSIFALGAIKGWNAGRYIGTNEPYYSGAIAGLSLGMAVFCTWKWNKYERKKNRSRNGGMPGSV